MSIVRTMRGGRPALVQPPSRATRSMLSRRQEQHEYIARLGHYYPPEQSRSPPPLRSSAGGMMGGGMMATMGMGPRGGTAGGVGMGGGGMGLGGGGMGLGASVGSPSRGSPSRGSLAHATTLGLDGVARRARSTSRLGIQGLGDLRVCFREGTEYVHDVGFRRRYEHSKQIWRELILVLL